MPPPPVDLYPAGLAPSSWKEPHVNPHHLLPDLDGPTPAELAAIDLEWPLIAAEMDLVEAEARLLTTDHPTELDWRRLRRAERRRLAALVDLLALTEERGRTHAPAA